MCTAQQAECTRWHGQEASRAAWVAGAAVGCVGGGRRYMLFQAQAATPRTTISSCTSPHSGTSTGVLPRRRQGLGFSPPPARAPSGATQSAGGPVTTDGTASPNHRKIRVSTLPTNDCGDRKASNHFLTMKPIHQIYDSEIKRLTSQKKAVATRAHRLLHRTVGSGQVGIFRWVSG